MIKVFDAFSGIGGFRSALERVGGFEFVARCEIDKFAQKAYRALYDTGGEQFYENIRNGRRIKEPNEPMFTLTVTDRHGIVHHGRIRRLMPIEAWRLQGFTDEQFHKVQAIGMSDAQLYKQAGNAVSVPVVEDIARHLLEFDKEINAYGK